MNARLQNLRNNISARGARGGRGTGNNYNHSNKRKGFQEDSLFSAPQPKQRCFARARNPYSNNQFPNNQQPNRRWPSGNPPQRGNWVPNYQRQGPGKYSANHRLQALQQNLQTDRQQTFNTEWHPNSQSGEDAYNSDRTHFCESDFSNNTARLNYRYQNENRNNEQVHRNQLTSLRVPNLQPQKESTVIADLANKNGKCELPTTTCSLQDSSNRVGKNLPVSTSFKSQNLHPNERVSQTELKPRETALTSLPNTAPWGPVSPTKIASRGVVSPTKRAPFSKPMSLEERLSRVRHSVKSKAHLDYTPLTRVSNSQETLNGITSVSEKPCLWTSNDNSNSTACNNFNDKCEDMDWCAFDEKEVALELAEIRKNPNVTSTAPKTSFQRAIAMEAAEIPFNDTLYKIIYIVIDTNIFLSHLNVVKKVMQLKINDVAEPTILVPWIVIQELDYIKDGKRKHILKNKAQTAVHFINDCLTNKRNLKGQSVRDAAQQDFASSNFDDSILHCCLQIRERRNRAILLTNDVNLKNKLLTEGFETYSHSEVFKKLDPFNKSFPREEADISEDPKAVEMKTVMSHLCTLVILKELRSSYGDLWNKMGSSKKTIPWSLQDCLDMFVQFWIPVFQMALSSQCLTHIEAFKKSLQATNGKVESVEKLFQFGLTLANFLKLGYPSHFASIQDLIRNLQEIYDS